MDTKINFDFVSPEESIVSSEVDMVQIPAVEGDAGILPNHAPYMTILRQGIVEVTFDKDNIKKYLVEGGFADVTPQKMTILAESSLNLTDIDSLLLKEKMPHPLILHMRYILGLEIHVLVQKSMDCVHRFGHV